MKGIEPGTKSSRLASQDEWGMVTIVSPRRPQKDFAMNTRKLLLVTAIVVSTAVPAISVADDTAALNTCMKKFVDTNLVKGQPVRLRAPRTMAPPASRVGTGHSEFVITAKGSDSGRLLAKSYCTVDANGLVIAMNDSPNTAPTKLSRR
jgi:hypothetical protein